MGERGERVSVCVRIIIWTRKLTSHESFFWLLRIRNDIDNNYYW